MAGKPVSRKYTLHPEEIGVTMGKFGEGILGKPKGPMTEAEERAIRERVYGPLAVEFQMKASCHILVVCKTAQRNTVPLGKLIKPLRGKTH